MKKILAMAAALIMLLGLWGCGASGSESPQPAEPAPANAVSEPSAAEEADAAEATASPQPEKTGPPAAVSVEPQVLLEDAGVKITVSGFDGDGFYGPELKILIENSSDTSLTVQARDVSVNGFMAESMLSCDVAAGKKANDALTFMESELDACGIDDIADMEFRFHIFRSDDWETYLDSPVIRVETSAADGFVYSYDDSGEVLYDAGGIRIISQGLDGGSSLFGPELILFIENASGADVTIQTRDVSVNGFMADPIFSQDVANGKRAVSAVTFMSSQLEENGVEKITDIELSLHIFDAVSWDTIADTGAIALGF